MRSGQIRVIGTQTVLKNAGIRLTAGVIVALALIATFSVISIGSWQLPEPAHASSYGIAPPPKPPKGSRSAFDPSLSASQKKQFDAAWKIYSSKAFNRKKKTLDYRKADKYDKGLTSVRRQFAAGLKKAGGHIVNISKAELKIVKRLAAKMIGVTPPRCKGKQGYQKYSRGMEALWLNNCSTGLVILAGAVIGVVVGVIAGILGATGVGAGAAIILIIVAAAIEITALYIGYVASLSSINAIVFVKRLIDRWPGPGTAWTPLVTVQPQL